MTRKNSTTRANDAAHDLDLDAGLDLDPSPPTWYPSKSWLDDGWFAVPAHLRPLYAEHGRIEAAEFRQFLTPRVSNPSTRKPLFSGDELPDGITLEKVTRKTDPFDENRRQTFWSYRFDGSTESAIAVLHGRLIKRLTRQYEQETARRAAIEADERACVVCSGVARWQTMARLERFRSDGYRSTTVLGYAHHGPCASAVLSAARDAARMVELDDGRTLADAAALWVEDVIDEAGVESLTRFKVASKGIAG